MAENSTCPRCGCELMSPAALGQSHAELGAAGQGREPAGEVGAMAEVGSPRSVLQVVAAGLETVPNVSLRGDSPALDSTSAAAPATRDRAARLRLFGEIAHGGMGTVLKGRDEDLGRDLAVKVLLEANRDDPELIRRFIEEAQIAGQLQHPGIAPVYELGELADRRPYFTMKLVNGQTLAQLLAARKEPDEGLPRLLGIFEQVCQTVAYAHTRGVIHRDLKPSNIMVGGFGEVQVMDWGLAKVLPPGDSNRGAAALGPPEPAPAGITIARVAGGSAVDRSRAGAVMGTPSYMAPEQARGEIDRIDERADVFALGSILCQILTGAPAFTGDSASDILGKAARMEMGDALYRLGGCAADLELVELARGCLAALAEDRPRDARAVSDRLTAHLISVPEKLRQAELARVAERARSRLAIVAGAAAVVLLAGGGGGLWWAQAQEAKRMARTTQSVNEALAEAAQFAGEAGGERADASKWTQAVSAAKRAEALLAQGDADPGLAQTVAQRLVELTGRRDAIETDRRLIADLEAARGGGSESVAWAAMDAAYGLAFRDAGLDVDATDAATAGAWVRAHRHPVELSAALDAWADVRRKAGRPEAEWRRLVAAAQAADSDPWRDSLRSKAAAEGSAALEALHALADDTERLDQQPAASLLLLASKLHEASDRSGAEAVLRRAWARFPNDFWVNFRMAEAPGLGWGGPNDVFPRPAEALRYLTAAVAVRPESAMAHDYLGIALHAAGDLPAAALAQRKAIRLNSEDPWIHFHLGATLSDSGDMAGAATAFRAAIRLEPDEAWHHSGLGNALKAMGDLRGALTELREAARLKPDFERMRAELAEVEREIGDSTGTAPRAPRTDQDKPR